MIKVTKFSTSGCPPCKLLAPIFEQIKSELSGVTFQNVDVDNEPSMAIQYKVRGVPTIIIEKDGQEVKRIVGVQPKSLLISFINSFK